MTIQDKKVLIDGLKKLSADMADLAAQLEGAEAQQQDVPAEKPTYTYEDVRAILAEKSRTGFRAEVKAILTAHGVKQLSDVKDPSELVSGGSDAHPAPSCVHRRKTVAVRTPSRARMLTSLPPISQRRRWAGTAVIPLRT